MSLFTVNVELTPEAQTILRQSAGTPGRILNAIRRAHDSENEKLVSHITLAYMNFPGPPGKTTLAGLRHVSGRLALSLRRSLDSRATISGNTVESSVGSNLVYMGVHEYGGPYNFPARNVRLRTNARGELIRQPGRLLAVFATSKHKRARDVMGKAYTATYPERAPIRKGVADRLPAYRAALSAAVVQAAPIGGTT